MTQKPDFQKRAKRMGGPKKINKFMQKAGQKLQFFRENLKNYYFTRYPTLLFEEIQYTLEIFPYGLIFLSNDSVPIINVLPQISHQSTRLLLCYSINFSFIH